MVQLDQTIHSRKKRCSSIYWWNCLDVINGKYIKKKFRMVKAS